MITMRAKLEVESVTSTEGSEQLKFHAVAKKNAYPADGSDEDNSFARWTPSASLEMTITNPDLMGKFERGQKFYVDFTPAD